MCLAPRSLCFLFSCAAIAFVGPHARAQVCEGNIQLATQAEVDTFNCTEVTGRLYIGDYNSQISDLTNLAGLTTVGGELVISRNVVLTNLYGLNDLVSVGHLSVTYNQALSNIGALSNLTSIGGTLRFDGNWALTNVDGLEGITSLDGNLAIEGSSSSSGDGLTDLSGLSNITSVGGNLIIGSNKALTNLDDLTNLTSIGGYIWILHNTSLTNLDGLASLFSAQPSVNGKVWIEGNDLLGNVDGLTGLTSISGELSLKRNLALANLSGFSSLTSIGGDLWLVENTSLTDLEGLGSLASIGGELRIENNWALQDLDGLENLTSAGGRYVRLQGNGTLTNIDALANLIAANPTLSSLWIRSNGMLEDVGVFAGIEAIEEELVIWNTALSNLNGFAGLTSVSGKLWIQYNDALENIDGLASLNWVGSDFLIIYNPSLTNVDGLANVSYVGGNLRVYGNASLSECTVGLAPLLLEGTIGGYLTIRDNAPGCNSYWEAIGGNVDAEDEATPLVTGLAAPYPNPTSGAATLAFTLAEPADVRLTLYDALGRRVSVLAEGTHAPGVYEAILGAGLPAGTYVVRFEAGERAFTERVTVVR